MGRYGRSPATVRTARGPRYPDPGYAAPVCAAAGADGITAHLREDRRHITDDDISRLMERLTIPLRRSGNGYEGTFPIVLAT